MNEDLFPFFPHLYDKDMIKEIACKYGFDEKDAMCRFLKPETREILPI